MNPAFRFAAVAVLSLATLVAGAGIFGAGQAHAQTATIDPDGTSHSCEVGEETSICTFKNVNGIQQVRLVAHTAFGEVELQKQNYRGCPTIAEFEVETAVLLSGGPLSFDVTPCPKQIGLRLGKTVDVEPIIVIVVGFVSPEGVAQIDTLNKCYSHFPNCDLASYECQHLGQGCPPRGRN